MLSMTHIRKIFEVYYKHKNILWTKVMISLPPWPSWLDLFLDEGSSLVYISILFAFYTQTHPHYIFK